MNNRWLALARERGKMDFGNRIVKEYECLKEKWTPITDKLNLLDANAIRQVAATIALENEKIFLNVADDNKYAHNIKEYAIPIVARLYNTAITPDLVSVQPSLGPAGVVTHYGRGHRLDEEEYCCKTRKMRACWNMEAQQDLRTVNGLDPKQELIAIFALELANEWDREVLVDLKNNCSNLETWDANDYSSFGVMCRSAIKQMAKKIGESVSKFYAEQNTGKRDGNWVVIPGEHTKELFPSSQSWGGISLSKVGDLEGVTVYADPLLPKQQMVMGYKGDNLESGYFFMPYVEMAATPVVIDPETFCPRPGILRRYGKKLLRGGGAFYGRIDIQNVPEKDKS